MNDRRKQGVAWTFSTGILQACIIGLLVWVATTVTATSAQVGVLTSRIEALENQVKRIQNSEDRRAGDHAADQERRRQ